MQLLINPRTHSIAAELTPNKEVIIHEPWISESIEAAGITVSSKFKKEHNCKWQIYPTDGKSLFAQAFIECAFPHGLQQKGYYWRVKNELDDLSEKELAQKILGMNR
jgi:hypothetical protein